MLNNDQKPNNLKLYKVNYVISQLSAARETALLINEITDEKIKAKFSKDHAIHLKKIHIFMLDNFKKNCEEK